MNLIEYETNVNYCEMTEGKNKEHDFTIFYEDNTTETGEVKEDFMHHFTGNVFIEISCNDKPSEIKATVAKKWYYWVHFKQSGGSWGEHTACKKLLYEANAEDIKKLLKSKRYQVVSGGDGGRVRGFKVPFEDFSK